MTSKEKAQLIIDQLREKGYSDEDIATAVVTWLDEWNNK